MTTVAVLADPPRQGVVLRELVEDGSVTDEQAATLYRAMLGDVCEAVRESGADLILNYRPADQLPDGVDDPEAVVRSAVEETLDETDDVRFEVQVGSSFGARAGNTVAHLLEREGVATAAVVGPEAAFLARQHIDSAAMKLRRDDVVLGPCTDGRVYYAGFGESIDFADAYAAPQVETLVERANDASLSVGFLPMLPRLETTDDLRTALPFLRSRSLAGRQVPQRTTRVISDIDLTVPESPR